MSNIIRIANDKLDENFPALFFTHCIGLAKAAGVDVSLQLDASATEPAFGNVTGVVEIGKALFALAGLSVDVSDETLKATYDIAVSLVPKEKLPVLLDTIDLDSFKSAIEIALIHAALTANKRLPILFKTGAAKYPKAVEFMKVNDSTTGGKYLLDTLAVEIANKKKAIKETSKQGSFEINLPGATEGTVVTRFPPEPSGYLHIGHAKALLLNYHFAQKYKGKMLLRFDDTNPSKEKDEFVNAIMDDCKTLGVEWIGPTYTSDYMDYLLELGEKMIKDGNAYVDFTPVEKMREERLASIESVCRSHTVEENLRLWKAMIDATEEGLKCCVRAKIDMKHNVGCMRDPTMFRCNLTPHHRQGTKYKCYPTYDFACPVVDSIEGVTHTLRTIEYHDRNEQFYWVCDVLGLRRPHIWDYSRLNFVYTLLSKRKLQWFVDQGIVEGWFDPRFPTVQGIIRRGLTVETLKEFMISQGASKNINLMEWDKIWALNKAKLEVNAPRYNAVVAPTKVPLHFSDIAEPEIISMPLHQKNEAVGVKAVVRSPVMYVDQEDATLMVAGEDVTLLSWGNVTINAVERDESGKVTKVSATTNIPGDVKKTKLKIHWVGFEKEEELIPATLVEYGPIITVKKPEEGQAVESIVNHNSKVETPALMEQAFRVVKHGDIIQLQRKGFYRVDSAPSAGISDKKGYVLIYIPDGKARAAPGLPL